MKNITFIYAGAGSGKTHTLTEKLTKWVKEHRGEANQIMFTTFTKKAANEIKERAQAKLLENQLFDEATGRQSGLVAFSSSDLLAAGRFSALPAQAVQDVCLFHHDIIWLFSVCSLKFSRFLLQYFRV